MLCAAKWDRIFQPSFLELSTVWVEVPDLNFLLIYLFFT